MLFLDALTPFIINVQTGSSYLFGAGPGVGFLLLEPYWLLVATAQLLTVQGGT